MPKLILLVEGQQFGKWSVLRRASGKHWLCKCACGLEKEVEGDSLRKGKTTQCRECRRIENSQRLCVRGHDTEIWGRSKDRQCRACIKNDSLWRNYRITLEDFIALYVAQNGKCALCGKDLGPYLPGAPGWGNGCRIEVDHEHGLKPKYRRQSVRGLLCGGRWAGCNRKLGHIDKPDWLRRALAYVLARPAQTVLSSLPPCVPLGEDSKEVRGAQNAEQRTE